MKSEPGRRDAPAWSVFLATLLVVAGGPLVSGADEADAERREQVPSREEKAVSEIARVTRPSLVTVTQKGRSGEVAGQGSGFVISSDGLVATNLHVIGESRPIDITLSDGRSFPVTAVHAWDRKMDLAVVRIDAKDLAALPLGDSDALEQGEPVVVMGNPEGLSYSVVQGVVSGVRVMEMGRMIQLALPIERGNSGGPVLDRQGRVVGITTMKALVTENLGFAMPVNALKRLQEKPNTVPIDRWMTIGVLNPRYWKPLQEGARWLRRGGTIRVLGEGEGFGGRTVCLSEHAVPEPPYEIVVSVKLDDETGAAGLAFAADGKDRHYGFYPSASNIRLTHFDGPTVYSWNILAQVAAGSYVPGDWNHLRVRVEEKKISGYVNGTLVVETDHAALRGGKVGLCAFRGTEPQFKGFRVGPDLASNFVPAAPELIARLEAAVEQLEFGPGKDGDAPESLTAEPAASRKLLVEKARALRQRAENFDALAQRLHELEIQAAVAEVLDQEEGKQIDLFHAGLLIARLAQPDLDIEAYRDEISRMAGEIAASVPADAGDGTKLDRLREYLFSENGFHGSHLDYYNRANSFLNSVIDDREGIPITLSVLFMELAQRIGVETVVGVGLPGHFVVRYLPADGGGEKPLLDVFDGGKPLSLEDAHLMVQGVTGMPLEERHLEPTSKRAILERMLRNLINIELGTGNAVGALPYLNLLLSFSPEDPSARFQRALLLYQKGAFGRAREDLRWVLDAQPPGIRLDRLRQLLESIDAQRE